jgi:hypothetical protein
MIQTIEAKGMDLGYRTPMAIDQALQGAVPDLTIVMNKAITNDPVHGVKTRCWPLAPPPLTDACAAIEQFMQDLASQLDTLIDPMD